MYSPIDALEESEIKLLLGQKHDQTGKFLREYSDDAIIAALREEQNSSKPVEQTLSITEAVFELIGAHEEDIPPHLVKALWHLEQLFCINRNLILKQ